MFELCPGEENRIGYCGSMAERLTRNEQVVSSILTSSSKKIGLAFGEAYLFGILAGMRILSGE